MLKRLQKSQDKVVTIWFEENPVQAQEGESVAAALLIAGVKYLQIHGLHVWKVQTYVQIDVGDACQYEPM